MENRISYIEDQILVMDAQDGSRRAMEALVHRWQKRLRLYIIRLVGDSDSAWDISQQCWLDIIRGIGKLQDPARFRSWIYRIATNKSINWIKRKRPSVQIDEKSIESKRKENPEDCEVRELLSKLKEDSRVVLSLYYFENLHIAEISAALKIPAGTVKSRMHKARQEFKEIVEKDSEIYIQENKYG